MKGTSIALLMSLMMFPFIMPYHTYPLVTFYAEFFTVVLALLFVIVTATTQKQYAMPLGAVVFALLFAILVSLQGLFLTYPERNLIAVAYIVIAVLVAVCASCYATQTEVEYGVLLTLAVGGFIMAVSGFVGHFNVLTVFGGLDIEPVRGMVGAIGQRNLFAAYVACGLIALYAQHRPHWLIVLLAALTMAAAESYAGSRIAWYFMVVTLLAAFVMRKHLAIAAAAWVFFALLRLGPAADVLGPGSALADAREAAGTRIDLLISAWRMWLEHPFFGVGWGEFAYEMSQRTQTGDGLLLDRHAHNIVVHVLAETGVVGLWLLLGAFAVWAREFLTQRLLTSNACAMVAVLFIVAGFSFTEFPLWHAQFLMLTAVMLGLLCSTLRRLPRVPLVVTAVSMLVLSVSVWLDYRAYEAFVDDPRKQISDVQRSWFRPNVELTLMTAGLFPTTLEHVWQERKMYERTQHAFPRPELLCRYAQLLYALGETKNADRVLARVLIASREPHCLIMETSD